MPYSPRKSRERSRKRYRWLLYVNATILVAIAVVGVLYAASLFKGNSSTSDAGPSGSPIASLLPSPTAATGSGDNSSPDFSPDPSPSASDDLPEASDDPPEASNGSAGGSVTLAFVGDILPASGVAALMEKKGVDYPFALAKPLLESADVTAGNLETPITSRGTPAQNKSFVFKGKPEYLQGIKNAGFDVLSLANNHTLDQGWEGLSDTMDALDDAKLRHMGSGNDDKEALAPVFMEAGGLTIAYLGVSNVLPETSWKAGPNHPGIAESYNPAGAIAAIKEAKKLADIVVIMVHWGKERYDSPIDAQTKLGHSFIDAGADLVIGSHPHVLQGFEAYKGKWIAYSLGNFVFTTSSAGYNKNRDTGVLTATCKADGSCGLKFAPMYATDSQPALMEPVNAQALLARLTQASVGVKIDEDGVLSSTG